MDYSMKLAIEGGQKAISLPLPAGGHGVAMMDQEECDAAMRVIKKQQLFRFLPDAEECKLFEQEAAEWMGVRYALFLTTGTAGLVCALSGLSIGPGDEVIVPAYTYIATASACITVGAVPVITEVDNSLGLDPIDVEKKITQYTKAIIAVHMNGVPCRLRALQEVAKRHQIPMIEDCCQCVGGSYFGNKAGSTSLVSAWSLNHFKAITCGEGGVMFTNDTSIFERALFQSDPAMPMWGTGRTEWSSLPFSRECYRGNEITAAIARVQLKKLPTLLEHMRNLKRTLIQHLSKNPRLYTPQHVDDPEGDMGLSFALIVNDKAIYSKFSEALSAEGLAAADVYSNTLPDRHIYAYWDSILNQYGATSAGYPWKYPCYKGNVTYSRDMCRNSLSVLSRTIRVPLHYRMTAEHAKQIAEAINKVDAGL